jgi:hypothetical protein
VDQYGVPELPGYRIVCPPGIREVVCIGWSEGRLALIRLASATVPFLGSIDTWIAFPGGASVAGPGDITGGPASSPAGGASVEDIPFDLVPERPGPETPEPAAGEAEERGVRASGGGSGGIEVPGDLESTFRELERRVREIDRRIIDLGSILEKLSIEVPGDLEESSIFSALYNSTGIYAVSPGGAGVRASYGLEAFALFSALLGVQVAREKIGPVARLVALIRYSRRGGSGAARAVACYEAVSKLLEYRGLGRRPGETPREYLARVAGELGPEEARVLEAATTSLEQALYRGSEPDPRLLDECARGYGVLLRRWFSIRRR